MKRGRKMSRRLFLEPLEGRMLMDASGDFFDVRQNSGPRAIDVLHNDVFAEDYSGPKQITSTSFGSKGGLIRIAEDRRSLEYDPPADGFGTETFTYYVDHQFSAEVTISIIAPLKHDRFTVNPNDQVWTLDVSANDPYWNDYQDAKRITSVSQTRLGGEVEISADGKSIAYTPPKYEVGKDSFMYFVDDLYPAEVIVDIVDPLVADKKLNIVWNTENITLNVLANDSFWDGYAGAQRITHLADTDPTKGAFSIASDGLSVTYTPALDFQGTQTIRYVVDSRYEQTITVQVNRPVQDDWFYLYANTDPLPEPSGSVEVPIDLIPPYIGSTGEFDRGYLNLLANDYFYWEDDRYAPGDSRRWVHEDVVDRITSVGTSEAGATIILLPDGQGVHYLPPSGFLGTDTFEYTADGKYKATVSVVVQKALTGGGGSGGGGGGGGSDPQPPSNVCRTLADSLVVNQNSSGNVINVVANDFQQQGYLCDPYYGVRNITEVTKPQNGTVTIGEDRKSISYTPDADFVGNDFFNYKVDGIWTESVMMNVVRRVRDDQFRVDPDSTNPLDVLPNDLFGADYKGAQRITGVTESEAGATVSINDGRDSIIYTPPVGFTGEDRFTYIVDGGLKAEVTVYVSSSRDALLRKFDSESLFGPMLEESLSRWDEYFGTTVERYPWYDDLVYLSVADNGVAGNATVEQRLHSETNTQVQGIDEADIVETDSEFLYVVRDGELIIARAWPADKLSVVSRTRIDGRPIGEYLFGSRLTVVSQSYESDWKDIFALEQPIASGNSSGDAAGNQFASRMFVTDYLPPRSSSTVVSVYDISDRFQPKLVQKTKLDGSYVESRRIDDQIFVVQRNNYLSLPDPTQTCESIDDKSPTPGSESDYFYSVPLQSCTFETRNAYIARVTQLYDTLLPHFASYDAEGNLVRTGLALAPEDIYQPQDKIARNLISVVSINMSNNEPGLSGASGILTNGADTIYGGWDGLYVLERAYNQEDGDITRILKFDWNADTGLVDFASFGHVAGYLLNQFSVDTFDGYLRIATTLWNNYGGNYSGNAENTIFVLRDDGGLMEVVGDLQNLGFTEYIKSVRFMGDRAFVTTFREIDPFFVIDMSNPEEPRPVGHVTLPGFSSYMQMIDENHVLTIGRNAVTETTGSTQVILFDVTDVTRPRIVGRHSFYRDSVSIAETDHHAFGWFTAHDVLAIPLAENRRRRIDADNDGYRETWEYYREDDLALLEIDVHATVESRDGVTLRGEVSNDSQVLRGAFIDNVLYSIAHDSITAVDINDPTTIFAHASISPDDFAPPDSNGVGESGSRDWFMAKQAREAIARHFGHPVSPMLLSVEALVSTHGSLAVERNFAFAVGDRVVRVVADAEGNVSSVDDQFQFAERNAKQWRNEAMETDVTGDGFTSPLDALVLINRIDETGAMKLATQSVVRQIGTLAKVLGPFYDVTGDGWLSPIDVLQIVNWLDSRASSEGEYVAAVDAIFGNEESRCESPVAASSIVISPLAASLNEPARQAVSQPDVDEERNFDDALKWFPTADLLSDTAT
jgi:uncharacterized secreted protein with C-terminal beta-propeller domain